MATDPKAEDSVAESWDLEDSPTTPTQLQSTRRSQPVLEDGFTNAFTAPPAPVNTRQAASTSHNCTRARPSNLTKPHSVELDPRLEYSSSEVKEALSDRTSSRSAMRPEKTTAVASRLIAGALGVKAPSRTEEQRAYDRATRDKETKRRQKEREDEEHKEMRREQAKRDMWDG